MMRLSLAIVISLFVQANAWMSPLPNKITPKEIINQAASFGAAATIAATCAFGPQVANAIDFTGAYSDPKHPNCARLVAIEGTTALVSGADGNPGCPTGEGRPWKLVGKVSGDEIFIDFSPKGGPKDLTGVWEGGKNPGIRFPDGNKWVLSGKP
mmetsp:Transcript_15805/g.22286  ORF Transcript_15805/g.22286 Transcript_15805/m.22286 type:complete len:154 (+) Transcript_15805:144-605(+)